MGPIAETLLSIITGAAISAIAILGVIIGS